MPGPPVWAAIPWLDRPGSGTGAGVVSSGCLVGASWVSHAPEVVLGASALRVAADGSTEAFFAGTPLDIDAGGSLRVEEACGCYDDIELDAGVSLSLEPEPATMTLTADEKASFGVVFEGASFVWLSKSLAVTEIECP